jgi:ABC-2 type transport system ATP-binding protein
MSQTSQGGPALVRVEAVTKRFGDRTALDAVSLELKQGEVFGLLGPNGAGKTTLVRVLVGLLAPDSGRVELHGAEGLSPAARGRLVGICPQELVVWERLTCSEQLELIAGLYGLPSTETKTRGAALLGELGLADRADTQARHLSGGMRRRLNLALAVVHEPRLLLLDEPEAGLDPQSRVLVRELIRRLAGRMTVVLTGHNMDEVDRTADRVGILDHGKLLVVDTPAALKARVGAGDRLSLELAQPPADTGGALLQALEALRPGLSASLDGARLEVTGLHVLDALTDVVNLLRARQVAFSGLTLRENSLEDVFLTLTGRRLS